MSGFTAYGRIDRVKKRWAFITMFANEQGDNPKGIKVKLREFENPDEVEAGAWVELTCVAGEDGSIESTLRVKDGDSYSLQEARDEYERLRRTLPDEW